MVYKISILYTTVGTEKEAEQLANLALLNKVAVCVNIIPNGKSIYLWNNNIEQSTECYLIFKTTLETIDELEQLIIKNHPYQTPAILKFNPDTSENFFHYITHSIYMKNKKP